MDIKKFTPQEMEEVAEVLREAFVAVHRNLDPEYQKRIDEFWLRLLKNGRPFMMVTTEGLNSYAKAVFGDDIQRDFVMNLTSTFFFLWGADNDTRMALMRNLSQSVCVDLGLFLSKPSTYRAMPRANSDRLVDANDAYEVLVANSWLAVMAMSTMFMPYRDFEEKVAKTPRRGTAS